MHKLQYEPLSNMLAILARETENGIGSEYEPPRLPTSYASKRNDGIFQRTSVLASGTTYKLCKQT
jgi:hypothetical protein